MVQKENQSKGGIPDILSCSSAGHGQVGRGEGKQGAHDGIPSLDSHDGRSVYYQVPGRTTWPRFGRKDWTTTERSSTSRPTSLGASSSFLRKSQTSIVISFVSEYQTGDEEIVSLQPFAYQKPLARSLTRQRLAPRSGSSLQSLFHQHRRCMSGR